MKGLGWVKRWGTALPSQNQTQTNQKNQKDPKNKKRILQKTPEKTEPI
jgi:hypothetical protein